MGEAPGVLLNDTVGRAPDVVATGLPPTGVVRETAVLVGMAVADGAARAVWVNCAESCPMAVATAAVLIALTSTVGAGGAPAVHEVSKRNRRTNRVSFVFIGYAVILR